MDSILQQIVASKKEEVRRARAATPLEQMRERATAASRPRNLYAAIVAEPRFGIHLIAEIKKSSPSAGLIRADFDPAAIAAIYHGCGATALSVLTDGPFFGGRLEHIGLVKEAVPLPVLLTPGAAEALAVKVYRQVRTAQVAPIVALAECRKGYQPPVAPAVLEDQMRIAIREATDMHFVPESLRHLGTGAPA